jgi:hypothetical protein
VIRVCTLQFGERAYFAESNRFGESYCARHGYSWHVLPGVEYPDNRDLRWSKVPGVIRILTQPDTDFVFYLDADAFVTNRDSPLDRLVSAIGDKDILIGEDKPRHINTGVWLARPGAIDILRFWVRTPLIDKTLTHRWPVDEAGFNEQVEPKYRDRIIVKTRRELNLVNGFVHHQMTGDPDTKKRIIRAKNP